MKSFSDSYKAAGVDVTAGYKAVELMKAHVAKTMTSSVLTGLGGFGGLVELDLTGINKPVLVSGTDGVGTKLKLAFLMDKHDTCLLYTSTSRQQRCATSSASWSSTTP